MRSVSAPLGELKDYANLLKQPPALAAEINLATLDYHGITLLAHANAALPEQLAGELQQRRAMMIANETLKSKALAELSAACAEQGLTPILFKGTALAYAVYPQPWLRPRTDSDLLVSMQEAEQFKNVCTELGYQKLFAIAGDYVSYQATYSRALTAQVALNIDLHWRINNRQILARAFNKQELLARATPHANCLGFVIPNNVDSLIIACLHRLGHHHREERLAWLYDIHLLAQQLAAPEWQCLAATVIEKKLAAITLNGLQISSELFGTELPAAVMRRLQAAAYSSEPSAIFLDRELAEWRIFFHELRALPDFSTRCLWLRENLLPDAQYTKRQMGSNSALIAYSKRFWRGCKRLVH